MAEPQVMVSMSEGLRDWLRDEARRLEQAWQWRHYLCPAYNENPANPTRPHISLAAVIEIMLEERRAHRARRRKSKLARKGRKRKLPSAAAMERLADPSARD